MAKKSSRPKAAAPAPRPAWRQALDDQSGPLYWLGLTLALWVILAVFYPGPLLEGQVFRSSDALNADAFAAVGDASLRAGHYPLWNPYLFAGMPSFGSLAYLKFVYPPTAVFNFLQQKLGFVPLTWWAAHLLFGGLGMMWLLSRWRLPTGALLLGAAVFLLFPKVVAWGVHGHGSKLGAAMYLPWAVGLALRIMDGRSLGRRLQAVGLLGLVMGLQFLRGHPQITYYTLGTVTWLALWNAALPFEAELRRVGAAVRLRGLALVMGGLLLGFAVGAVLLVPGHDYAAVSIRGQDTDGGGGVGLDYATGWSLDPAEVGTLVLPGLSGFGRATYLGPMPFNDYPNYLGFLLLLLAAAAWRRSTRPLCISLGVFGVLVLLTSFGGDFYALLYDVLPFFNKMRVPSMILVLLAFAVALLAPRAVTAWRDGEVVLGRPLVLPVLLGVLGVGCLVAGLGAGEGAFREHLASLAAKSGKPAAPVLLDRAWGVHGASLVRIGLVLMVAAAALEFSRRHAGFRRHGLVWVVLGLVLLDLGHVDRLVIHPEQALVDVVSDGQGGGRLVPAGRVLREPLPDHDVEPGPSAAALAAVVGHDRVWPLGSAGQRNLWMADGIRSLGGYSALKMAAYERIRSRLYGEMMAARLANWLAARAVTFDRAFSPQEVAALDQVGLDLSPADPGPPAIYRNAAALPRARLIDAWRPAAEAPGGGALDPFLDALAAGRIDPAAVVHLDPAPDPAPVAGAEPLPAPEFVVDGLDEVVLRVDTPRAAVLVLADMAADGWSVTVDGAPRPLLRADLVLRGVALEAGNHEVRFVYADPAVRRGLTLTLVGAIIILGLLLSPMVLNRLRPTALAAAEEASPNDE